MFPTKDEMKDKWNRARTSFDKQEGNIEALLEVKDILDLLTVNLLSS